MSTFDKTKKTTFVLGAGFTKAFAKKCPLLWMKVGKDELEEKIIPHPFTKKIISQNRDGDSVDVEGLLSRATERMPYDDEHDSSLRSLAEVAEKILVDRISEGSKSVTAPDELRKFAQWCKANNADCITFNYDLVLDLSLHQDSGLENRTWNTDAGYGFYLENSGFLTTVMPRKAVCCAMTVHKLHGSLNWYPRIGSPHDLRPGLLVNRWRSGGVDTDRIPDLDFNERSRTLIDNALEDRPFIVPPVNSKEGFYSRPILKLVWRAARKSLLDTQQVVFIGYSLPESDRSARLLFSESVPENASVFVVTRGSNPDEFENLKSRYRGLLESSKRKIEFIGGGAVDWVEGTLE
ncbi:MAG TPA: hypothetical protein EYO33_09805 [Phycisphaerales bacterium]|nr:hypothetical protein [Phycisphaerales bacterium]